MNIHVWCWRPQAQQISLLLKGTSNKKARKVNGSMISSLPPLHDLSTASYLASEMQSDDDWIPQPRGSAMPNTSKMSRRAGDLAPGNAH